MEFFPRPLQTNDSHLIEKEKKIYLNSNISIFIDLMNYERASAAASYPQDDFFSSLIGYYKRSTCIYYCFEYIHDIIVHNVLNRYWNADIFKHFHNNINSLWNIFHPRLHSNFTQTKRSQRENFYIIIKIHSPAYIEFYLLHNGYLISDLNVLRFVSMIYTKRKWKWKTFCFIERKRKREKHFTNGKIGEKLWRNTIKKRILLHCKPRKIFFFNFHYQLLVDFLGKA